MWIDTHCHLDFISENKSKDESLFDNSLLDFIICPSANHKSFNILKKLNQKNKSIVYAFGYHPLYLNDLPDNPIQYLENEILNSQPIAVGEIGLDFYLGNEQKEKQKKIFQQQLDLASKYKPRCFCRMELYFFNWFLYFCNWISSIFYKLSLCVL